MVSGTGTSADRNATAAEVAVAASFEEAIGELETLVQRMESGALSLEASLAAYRRGAELVAFCRKSLAGFQQQVKILEGDLLRPFDVEPDAFDDAGADLSRGAN